LRIIAISDLHMSKPASKAAAEATVAEEADVLFVAGDISHGKLNNAVELLEILGRSKVTIFFVPGNMDTPQLSSWSSDNLRNLHGRCERYGFYTLVGLGGSIMTPFNTPFEFNEQEAEEILNRALQKCDAGSLVLISHSPPRDTDLDMTRSGMHAGSRSVRDFIISKNPLLVVCGHIHEAQGIDKLGETTIVNPGPAYLGGYARIELDDKVQVRLARFSVS